MPGVPFGPLLSVSIEVAKPAPASGLRVSFGRPATPDPDLEAAFRALSDIVAADPDLSLRRHADLDQIELGGSDETRLDAALAVYTAGGHPPLAIGAPQIGYREAILRRTEIDFTFKHPSPANFARVVLVFEPDPGESSFASLVVGGAVPDACVAGVAAGIERASRSGCLGGFPVVGTRVQLIDGAYHDRDSSPEAFETAASCAFRDAMRQAGGLLEPIMRVVVTGPEDYRGAIEGDLRSRRGWIESREMRADTMVVVGLAPLANMLGYINELREFSERRSSHVMSFGHYRPVPPLPRAAAGRCGRGVALVSGHHGSFSEAGVARLWKVETRQTPVSFR